VRGNRKDRPVALVAGGSRGIGAATAALLAADGFDLMLAHRGRTQISALAEHATSLGAKVDEIRADLSDSAQAEDVGKRAARRSVAAIAWCAGELDVSGLREATAGRATSALTAACISPMIVIRESAGSLSAARGSVVLVSSVAAIAATHQRVIYSTAKAAMTGLARSLAIELAPQVRVNAVLPGVIDTAMTASLHHDAGALQELSLRIPLGRTGSSGECAQLIAYLISESASYVTGAAIPVDGGLLARSPAPGGDMT
jgi:NAD(P)-dependent dehydrogenase (short-subunit alcohol dehydrogenase family)